MGRCISPIRWTLQLAAFALATVATSTLVGAQAVRGRVYDLASGAGVPGAEVAIWRGDLPLATVRADSTGLFVIGVRDTGTYRLITRKVGFFGGAIGDLRLAARDTFELLVRMERIAQLLETLRTEGKKAGLDFTSGFEDRRRMGVGSFLGPKEIAARGFQRAPELLYGVPGVQVVIDPTNPGLQIARIVSSRASGFGVCEPTLFVDGIPIAPEDLYREHSSNTIEAIEVYHSSEVPSKFNIGRSLCGAVLFWSKARLSDR